MTSEERDAAWARLRARALVEKKERLEQVRRECPGCQCPRFYDFEGQCSQFCPLYADCDENRWTS